tara:strand:- start:1368 stop:2144 length:777 start_codon:yes stop_codon:yes gene_type:complete
MGDENNIDVVTGEEIGEIEAEEQDVTGEDLISKKSKREMTPEYKAVLVERLKKAREVKKKADQLGVLPKRRIKPDPDEPKRFYCSDCRKSYKTAETLAKHINRFHKEKKLSNIVKEKEMTSNNKKDAPQNEKEAPTSKAVSKEEDSKEKKEPVKEPTKEKKADEKNEAALAPITTGVTNEVLAPTITQSILPPPPPIQKPKPPKPSGPPKFTYEEFKEIEKRNNERKKQEEKAFKAKQKQDHILRTIQNMKNGGIPLF